MMRIASIVFLTSLAVTASAADLMKPGLWQSSVNIDMPQGMPQISPEQMAKMKQMGIELPFGHPVITQVCITPEEAAKRSGYKPHMREGDQCQMKDVVDTPGHYSGTMECSGDMKGEGHFAVDRASSNEYSGTWDFAGSSRGRPMQLHAAYTGQYLGADCGSVKPVTAPQ